jgi:hypothetical protein
MPFVLNSFEMLRKGEPVLSEHVKLTDSYGVEELGAGKYRQSVRE